MLNNKLILCAAGALMLCATACSEKDLYETTDVKGSMRLTASSEAFGPLAGTRTQVGGQADDGTLLIEWLPGDSIGVFGNTSVNVLFTSTNTEAAGQADFAGTMSEPPRYAYYPYSAEATTLTAIPVEIPTEQLYADESSVAQYDVKATDAVMGTGPGVYNMDMRQMAALVRFEINLVGAGGFATDERLLRVELETGDHATGSYTYDLSNLDAGLAAGAETSSRLNLTFTGQPSLAETVIAYAVVAPGKQQGTTWNCRFITDCHTVEFTTEALCDFESGKYYTVPLNAQVIENNAAEISETEETANCYIVTSTGRHDFLATVIGNGQKGIIPGAGFHTASAYINPQSAKLLWEDTQGFVSDVQLTEEGRVEYTVNQLSGNAVIAVYSGPDQTGDILWSWHIWGTGGEMPQDEEYTNKAGSQFMVMDRTLGAHSKTSTDATLYQWGRKDPIPNTTVYYVNGAAQDIETSFPVYTMTMATIEESVRHPGEMVKQSDRMAQDWLAVSNNYLWGDTNGKRAYDLGDASATHGWTHGKTIYDPSPVGYRVGDKYTWTGFVKRSDGNTGGISGVTNRLDYINYVKYDNGYYFMRNESDTEGTYYPMTGYRTTTEGSMVSTGSSGTLTRGYMADYWSASPRDVTGSEDLYSCYFSIGNYAEDPGVTGWSSGNKVATCENTSSRRTAYAIRCVRE